VASTTGFIIVRVILLAASTATMLLGAPWSVYAADSTQRIDEVAVVGESPGPQMWRVSRADAGGHTVWVLGVLQPLPEKMVWHSKEAERVVAEAQEVIPTVPKLDAHLNPVSAVRLFVQWRRVRVNENGATLREVLPPPLYNRFAALIGKYAPGDKGIERLQPMLASDELRERALSASGLTMSAEVEKSVLKLANRHHVAIHVMPLQVPDARELLQEIGTMSVDAQIHCVEPMIAMLENSLDVLKVRAGAWARGDVSVLRALPIPDAEAGCWDATEGSPHLRDLAARAHGLWIESVEDALAKNNTTLALQQIDRLLGSQGYLAELRTAGYDIEGPQYVSQ
jgi:hypothetical protein